MDPNPPRELELLPLGNDVVELNGLRGVLTGLELAGPERNAVDGAVVVVRRERSRLYEEEPDPQCQVPQERRRPHGSSCARGVAPGTGTAAGAVCAAGWRHSAERAGIR